MAEPSETTTVIAEAAQEVAGSAQDALMENLPALNHQIGAMIGKVVEWLETSEGFLVEHVPLLIKEILLFEGILAGFWLLAGIGGIWWGIHAYRWSHQGAVERLARAEEYQEILREAWREEKGGEPDYDDALEKIFSFEHYAIPISGAALAVGGVLSIVTNATILLKITIAQRLFLIEYLRRLAG